MSLCGTGNCLGESGSEALREILEAKGLADCLESLSDDEGTDSEGEDQEHEGEQGEEGEGEEREDGEVEGDVERKATSSPQPQVNTSTTIMYMYRGHPIHCLYIACLRYIGSETTFICCLLPLR